MEESQEIQELNPRQRFYFGAACVHVPSALSEAYGAALDYGQGYPYPCCGAVPCWLRFPSPLGSLPRAGSFGEPQFTLGAPGAVQVPCDLGRSQHT